MDSGSMLTSALELLVVFLVLIFIVYPFVLSAANRLINGFWSGYGRTLGTVILTGIVAIIVTVIIGLVVHKSTGSDHAYQWLLDIISIIVTALVGGALMNAFVRHKDGGPLGFGRTALACLVLGIVVVLIGLGTDPWAKSIAQKMKSGMPTPAVTSSAPAAPSTAPASISNARVVSPTIPAQASTAPAKTATVPAQASSASGAMPSTAATTGSVH